LAPKIADSARVGVIAGEERILSAISGWTGLIDIGGFEKYNVPAVLGNLREKLSRTRQAFKKFEELFQSGKRREEVLNDLAEAMILADVGVSTTEKIIDAIRERTNKDDSPSALKEALKAELSVLLSKKPGMFESGPGPSIVMVVGTNGGGKTTSLAKLARKAQGEGKKVMMAAADTFRAAAQEQLGLWGKRLNVPVIRSPYGADPASVVFDAVRSFKAQGCDLLLVDTAGRVHTNANLMNELEKIKRIIAREVPGAPHEILLVLDAVIGQNALVQAREFLRFSGITGIFLTKLDGTAKGGAVIGISDELELPIKYIGVGEGEEDLVEFEAGNFVDALLS
jgi:fused signal recognition particle receptor